MPQVERAAQSPMGQDPCPAPVPCAVKQLESSLAGTPSPGLVEVPVAALPSMCPALTPGDAGTAWGGYSFPTRAPV